jgi:hypothetical protein
MLIKKYIRFRESHKQWEFAKEKRNREVDRHSKAGKVIIKN